MPRYLFGFKVSRFDEDPTHARAATRDPARNGLIAEVIRLPLPIAWMGVEWMFSIYQRDVSSEISK
jgi:hypothetical protein